MEFCAHRPDEKNKMQDRIEYVQGKLPDYLTMTLTQYTDTIRWLMNNKEWEKAKRYLDAADPEWGYTTEMHYLNGRFYYHADKPDEARRHLLDALQEDNSNTDALELLAKIEQEQGNYSTAIVHINVPAGGRLRSCCCSVDTVQSSFAISGCCTD